jgi:hypothetical protein
MLKCKEPGLQTVVTVEADLLAADSGGAEGPLLAEAELTADAADAADLESADLPLDLASAALLESADALRAEARALEAGNGADDAQLGLDLRHLEYGASAAEAARHQLRHTERRTADLATAATDVEAAAAADVEAAAADLEAAAADLEAAAGVEAADVPLETLVALLALESLVALVALLPDLAAKGDVRIVRSKLEGRPGGGYGWAGWEARHGYGPRNAVNHGENRYQTQDEDRGTQSPRQRLHHEQNSQWIIARRQVGAEPTNPAAARDEQSIDDDHTPSAVVGRSRAYPQFSSPRALQSTQKRQSRGYICTVVPRLPCLRVTNVTFTNNPAAQTLARLR